MALFQYKALQTNGALAQGNIEAGGRQEAFRMLEAQGLNPIGLDEKARGAVAEEGVLRLEWKRKKVTHRALEDFTRQLSNLLSAGVPLARALHILCRESAAPAAQKQWKAVHDMVIDGASLAGAMGQFPQTFPRVYVAMVQAGETGGFLDVVLSQIAEFQSREKELRGKAVSALIYPIILAVLMVAVLIFLMIFFIPKFKEIFLDFGAELPMLTQYIMTASDIVKSYGIFLALGIGIVVALTRQWLASEKGRRAWEYWVLRLPIFGHLVAKFSVTRFCRMLGTLIGSGVPMINALRVARESLGNQTLIDAVTAAIERVQQGDRLADSLSDCRDLFPGSVLEMISVSEESGRLDKELIRMSTVMESDLDRQLKTAVALAEPAMLVVMAVSVGLLVVGMVLPIFTMQDYIK